MKPSLPSRSSGFSLLELMVAISILALALGVLYRVVGGSVRTIADTSHYSHALVIAQSVLKSLPDTVPPGGWQGSGAWEGYRWSVASSTYSSADSLPPALYRVQVEVVWDDGLRQRQISLVTLLPERR